MREEDKIIERCKNGDREAFNELIEQYRDRVVNTAFGILSDMEDAADAAQEVFIKIYRSIKGFKGESEFSTWVYRITVNVCKDVLRQRSRRRTISLNSEYEDNKNGLDIKDTSMSPEERAGVSETQREVRRAIAALKPEHSVLITLCDIEGVSYESAAAILKLPVGTVKSRLNRARASLKKELSKNGNFFD